MCREITPSFAANTKVFSGTHRDTDQLPAHIGVFPTLSFTAMVGDSVGDQLCSPDVTHVAEHPIGAFGRLKKRSLTQ